MDHQHRPISMRPSVWGPIFWNTMHIVSLGYPADPTEEQRHAAEAFYTSLAQLIPCPRCREHYQQHLHTTPPATESRDALVEWVWKIHNKVNEDIGKPTITFGAFQDNMESLAAGSASTLPLLSGIAIGVGISAAVYYFVVRK